MKSFFKILKKFIYYLLPVNGSRLKRFDPIGEYYVHPAELKNTAVKAIYQSNIDKVTDHFMERLDLSAKITMSLDANFTNFNLFYLGLILYYLDISGKKIVKTTTEEQKIRMRERIRKHFRLFDATEKKQFRLKGENQENLQDDLWVYPELINSPLFIKLIDNVDSSFPLLRNCFVLSNTIMNINHSFSNKDKMLLGILQFDKMRNFQARHLKTIQNYEQKIVPFPVERSKS